MVDFVELATDAPAVLDRYYPDWREIYARHGFRLPQRLDRIYVNNAARHDLQWRPDYDFRRVLDGLARGALLRSELTLAVGRKGYHEQRFEDGPYPVEEASERDPLAC